MKRRHLNFHAIDGWLKMKMMEALLENCHVQIMIRKRMDLLQSLLLVCILFVFSIGAHIFER